MSETYPVGEPPDWINPEGQLMWAYLVDLLREKLLAVDRPAFTQLCAAGGAAEAAQKDIHTRGVLVKGRSKDHSADDETDDGERDPYMVKNPAEAVARQQMVQFVMLAKEFGLTPAARVRMKLEIEKLKPEGPQPEID